MQEICRLWEGNSSRVHRHPGVRMRPTRPLHGVRLRTELKDGVEDSGVDQTWNGILDRQCIGPGQGEAGLKMAGEKGIHSFNSYILKVHLVCLALCWTLEILQ